MTVYVRWYGNIFEGELLEGEHLGMKQVRIPLDGRRPVALFTAGHVYQTEAEARAGDAEEKNFGGPRKSATGSRPQPKKADPDDIMPGYDRLGIEAFKEAYWDHERNHLRIDKLDEFYHLWCMAMDADPEALRLNADEVTARYQRYYGSRPTSRNAVRQPEKQASDKPRPVKPTKRQLRSCGEIEFADATQLALF